MRFRAVLWAVGGVLLCLGARGAQPAQKQLTWGMHLDGRPVTNLAPGGERVLVLFFVASDCPVSNRTFPEMRHLREEFAPRAVRFWFVYPNVTEKSSDVLSHQRSFGAEAEALQDPAGALVRLSHAVATPEMVVLVPDSNGWRPVYAGRVDDRYVRLGVERPVVTRHFGEDVLKAVLAGKSPEPPTGAPVGCAIVNPGVQ